MRIAELGNTFNTTQKIAYVSETNLLEYDAIIIDFSYIIHSTGQQVANIKELIAKRKDDLEDFIRFKELPIVYITPRKYDALINVPGRTEKVDFDFFVPIPAIKVVNETGNLVVVNSQTPLSEFLSKYKESFRYHSYLESKHVNTLLVTPYTKKTLSFYDEKCVFLPNINVSNLNQGEFLSDLVKSIKKVKNFSVKENIPIWTSEYFLPGEREVKNQMVSVKNQIAQLNKKLEENISSLDLFAHKKRMFTSSGYELEICVKEIFQQLGFEFIEAEENRDDLILRYQDKIAVIEIKGVTKSAAEKHAAQLEKWAANYFESTLIQPKAILLVNTYKDLPLKDRLEPNFPDQMIRYSTQRTHCLMTTLNLLNIYYTILLDESKKDEVIESIFTTVGVYDKSNLKTDFIEFPE